MLDFVFFHVVLELVEPLVQLLLALQAVASSKLHISR
jgi:hypothetical protein